MRDGSDAVADWPLLNALVNTACGASWVSVHHGGGVGMGKSIHAGQVCVADGTPEAGERHPPRADRRPGHGRRAPRRRRLRRRRSSRRSARGLRMPMLDPEPAMSALAITGAAQVLRPPDDGLPYLRHDRAGELTLEPGAADASSDDRIAALRGRSRDADVRIDARGCAVLPGLRRLPHAPAVRGLARSASTSRRSPACPTRRSRAPAAGSRRRRARCAEATDERCWRRPGRSRREMLAHGTTTFECKTGYGLSVDGRGCARCALAARSRARGADRPSTGAARPRGARRATTADALDGRGRRCCPRRRGDVGRARHLRRVGRVPQRAPARGWASSPPRRASPLRAHVEQFNANRSVPVALARGRALGRPPRVPAPRRRRAARGAPSAPRCCCPAPSSSAPSASRPARDAGRRGRDLRAGHRLQPGHLAGLLAAAGHRARRAPLRLVSVREALLACTLNAAWVLGLSDELGLARGRQARRPRRARRPGRAHPLPLRAQPGGLVVRAGEVAYVRPDAAWRVAS